MLWFLFVVFIVLPFVELYVIVQVAGTIGIVPTFALMIAVGAAGAWLCKREGIGVLRRVNRELEAGRIPTAGIIDGALILLAGALMLTPGFVTDILGLVLLLPPTRSVVRAGLIARFKRRIEAAARGGTPAGFTFVSFGGEREHVASTWRAGGDQARPRRRSATVIDAESFEARQGSTRSVNPRELGSR